MYAFAMSRPDIGYIQGMSFIVGLFLLYMDKYTAFVCFSNLMTSECLMQFYQLDEEYLILRLELYQQMARENMPDIYEHLLSEGVYAKMYLFEWLLTLYTKVINLDIVCRIWDLMLVVEGPIVLYKAAIAILTTIKEELLKSDMS